MAAGDSDFGAVGGVPDRGYPDVTLDGVREVQGIRFRRVRVQGTRVPLLPKVRSRALACRIAMLASLDATRSGAPPPLPTPGGQEVAPTPAVSGGQERRRAK